MIKIRIADREDAELIADMSRQTFYETFASQNSKADMDQFMNETFTREKLIKEVGEEHSIFLLASDEDKPVGYARLRQNNTAPELGAVPAIEIARIYAVSTAIGKGVGKALMQHCIDLAIAKKKEWIWLGVWEHNQRAIAFYRQWGFEKFAEHIFMLGDDPQLDWLMKKNILPAP